MKVFQTLFASSGNAPPQLAVTRQLVSEGHEVVVLAHEASRKRVEATGATMRPFLTLYPDMDSARPETDPFRDWEVNSTFAAGRRLRDVGYREPVHPVARESAEAIAAFGPDVVVFDFMLVGAAIAAEAARVPAVAMVHCPYLLPTPGVPPYGFGFGLPRTFVGRGFHALLRRVGVKMFDSVGQAVNEERVAHGLAPLDDWVEQITGAPRVLVFTARELDFAGRATLPDSVRYVGPAFEARDETWTSPWAADDARPLVVISLSTTYMRQEELANRILEAVTTLPVRALLTAGPALDPSDVTAPDNAVVVPFVPHRAVLPEASLMVSHAGWGSINAALSCGVPMVCIPCGRDQPDGARRVETAGAGVIVSKSASPERIRDAIADALADTRLRDGAARIAAALGRQDGATTAVREIVDVVNRNGAPAPTAHRRSLST